MPVAHWSLLEMARAFDFTLDEYVFLGGYPGSVQGRPGAWDLDAWRRHIARAITAPAIDRDIVQLTRVRKPALMRRLMDLAPRHSGQIMSYNKLLGQLRDAGNVTTVAQYLEHLSDAGLVTGLSRYAPSPHRSRASSPKLNVLNTALNDGGFRLFHRGGDGGLRLLGAHRRERRGSPPWEHAGTWARGSTTGRDRAKRANEVDFVVERGPHLLGIEVKSGRPESVSGLKAFPRALPRRPHTARGDGRNSTQRVPVAERRGMAGGVVNPPVAPRRQPDRAAR